MNEVGAGQNEPGTPSVLRRNFCVAAIGALGSLIAAAMALPALMYLLLPPRLRGQGEWVEVGDISQLPAGAPVKMTFRRMRVDGWKVLTEDNTAWVVRSSNLQVFAFGPQCTHLGCAYHWDRTKDEFFCPCHNSLFAIDGKVIGGPARQPLHRYETRVEGNRLFVGRLTMSA